jgi:adenylate kinase family enzyme
MRVLLFGNSGAGKTAYAPNLARAHALAQLDLDPIVWEPGQVAVLCPAAVVNEDLLRSFERNCAWVIEGCYGELIETAAPHCSDLVFLNPGLAACRENCRRRPGEPHKYAAREEQDARLAPLLDWVAADYARDDPCSYARHRRLCDAFAGPKRELTFLPPL